MGKDKEKGDIVPDSIVYPSNNDDDDCASENSDSTIKTEEHGSLFGDKGSSSSSWLSSMSKIGEFGTKYDDAIRSLYVDPDLLEKKCLLVSEGHSSIGEEYNDEEEERKRDMEKRHQDLIASTSATKTPDGVIGSMSDDYFQAEFDPVHLLVKEISAWDESKANENFMKSIEACDTDKDMVIEKLSVLVEKNYPALMECMIDVDTIDVNMSKALVQISGARRGMTSSSQKLAAGSMKISNLNKQKDQVNLLMDVANSLKDIKSVHHSMVSHILTGDTGKAAECAFSLLQSIHVDNYKQFVALDGYEQSIQKNIYTVRQKTDKALLRLCSRKFASSDYSNIIKTYLLLDSMGQNMGVELIDLSEQATANTPEILLDTFGCMDGLSNRIYRFQVEDIEACLRTAVLEFIYAGVQHRSKLYKNMGPVMSIDSNNSSNMLELEDLPLEELYTKLIQEMTIPCIVRSCELLADVVHTHYLITQWHCSPFDQRNSDTEFLHRCPIDLNDVNFDALFGEDDDESDGIEEEHEVDISEGKEEVSPRTNSHNKCRSLSFSMRGQLSSERKESILSAFLSNFGNKSNENNENGDACDDAHEEQSKLKRLQGAQLTVAFQSLTSCRSALWEELITALAKALNSISLTSSIALDDFLNMSWAINAMIKLGEEFCESSSKALRTCLEYKSKEYYAHLHSESFHVLKEMVDADTWRNVPIRLEEMGGILGVIKQSILTRSDSKSRKNVSGLQKIVGMSHDLKIPISLKINQNEEKSDVPSLLVFFAKHGNPLHFMTLLDSDDEDDEDNENDEEDDDEEDGNKEDIVKANANKKKTEDPSVPSENTTNTTSDKTNKLNSDFLSILLEEDNKDKSMRKRKGANQSTSMVVTRSSLNGLARCAGRYLQMMHLMPSAAAHIFGGLCQLFDLYICNVFHGFIPAVEREKFLAKKTKMISQAPDQEKDYEALELYLERALSEVIKYMKIDETKSDSKDPMESTGFNWETVPVSSILQMPGVIENCDGTSFFGLNARIVAAESCWFAATILLEIKSKLSLLLPDSYKASCDKYVSQFQLISSQLRALIYRSICPQLIESNMILAQIVDVGGWDSKKHRSVDTWAEKMIKNCESVWNYMGNNDEFAEAASLVREQVWLELCQANFDVVLDGVCRAKRVSSEGRLAMIRDVVAIQEGLEKIHTCRSPRTLPHVEAYLRSASLASEEMMLWIQDNYQSYAYRHMYGLVVQTFSSVMSINQTRLKEAISFLDELYDVHDTEDESKDISNIFSKR